MAQFTRPKDLIARLSDLSEAQVSEMYSLLIQRAMETNPLKSWTIRSMPTREDLSEVLSVLPPKDMEDLELIYFS